MLGGHSKVRGGGHGSRLPYGTPLRAGTVLLAAEAAFTSLYVRFALACLPFRYVRHWLGVPHDGSAASPAADSSRVHEFRRVLRVCEHRLPWANCYTMALTARLMLKRRNLAPLLFIGIRRDAQRQLAAHAWVTIGDSIVVGDGDLTAFAIHGRYR